jgi:hypothetical protein
MSGTSFIYLCWLPPPPFRTGVSYLDSELNLQPTFPSFFIFFCTLYSTSTIVYLLCLSFFSPLPCTGSRPRGGRGSGGVSALTSTEDCMTVMYSRAHVRITCGMVCPVLDLHCPYNQLQITLDLAYSKNALSNSV